MAAELIGYIYSIDRRVSYVKKNGETLILNSGSHITSHTDAEIIAAPVPINITYTTGDTALKCMYVPKSYLDKQTHVPASIFLKEAHAVRDLIDAVQNNLDTTNTTKANVSAIVPSAAVESSTTASQSYAAGDYVVVNGILRKVRSTIAKGDAISDSNSTATTVTDSIKSVEDNASKAASTLNNVSKMFIGTVVSTVESSSTASGHEAKLFTKEEFKANFGRYFNASKDYVGVMNADGSAAGTYLDSVTHFASGNIWVGVPGVSNGNKIRLNFIVVLGD